MKTPIFNIHDLILVLTLTVCVLLVIFQLVLSKQKEIASRLLSAFFVCVGVSAVCNLLLWDDYIRFEASFAKINIAYGLALTQIGKGVCLYLYVIAITRENFRLGMKDALHLLNVLVVFGLLMVGNIDSDGLRFISHAQTAFSVKITTTLWHYLKIVPVVYALVAVIAVNNYKQQLKNFYSTLSLDGPQWLFLLTLGFALNWSWSLLVHLLGQLERASIVDVFGIADNYITFVLVNALFVYSLLYAHQLIETRDTPKEKESLAGAEPSPGVIDKILHGMEVQQLYLKHNLNIEEFAKHVGVHFREVSTIINKNFNTNFFEFVNLYRVNKAKEMLVDPKLADTTILDILLEAGFNSKSSFHRFFKRYAGMSAADYRKQHAATKSSPTK